MSNVGRQRESREGAGRPHRRQHDGDGISQEARRIINEHGLSMSKVLGFADHYALKEGTDFNMAPTRDFEGAPLGRFLTKALNAEPSFAPNSGKFAGALSSFDYATSDGIIDKWFRGGAAAVQTVEEWYGRWRENTERLEGLNVALFRAARDTDELRRFIQDFGELGNYLSGRWRRAGDGQNRVPTTVGTTNRYMGRTAVAMITYDASAVRDWIQPVRYSPYPRNLDTQLEQFGHEKDGSFANEGEVHLHTGCPIPSRDHINIAVITDQGRGRQEIVERYGGTGIIERYEGAGIIEW